MKICSNCQKHNVDDAVFCRYCGSKIEDEITASSEQQSTDNQTASLVAENTTPMNKSVLKQLYKRTKFLGWLCLGLGIFLFVLAVLGIIVETGDQSYLLFIGIVDTVCGAVLLYLEHASVAKNKVVTDDMYIVYKFFDQDFCVLTFDGSVKKEETHLSYKNVNKVRKIDNYIFLYLGANALVVNLNTFLVGTKEDFVAHLKTRCENVKIRKI